MGKPQKYDKCGKFQLEAQAHCTSENNNERNTKKTVNAGKPSFEDQSSLTLYKFI